VELPRGDAVADAAVGAGGGVDRLRRKLAGSMSASHSSSYTLCSSGRKDRARRLAQADDFWGGVKESEQVQ
jgi:hypothetical protein